MPIDLLVIVDTRLVSCEVVLFEDLQKDVRLKEERCCAEGYSLDEVELQNFFQSH
jgi:hypothetical protein